MRFSVCRCRWLIDLDTKVKAPILDELRNGLEARRESSAIAFIHVDVRRRSRTIGRGTRGYRLELADRE